MFKHLFLAAALLFCGRLTTAIAAEDTIGEMCAAWQARTTQFQQVTVLLKVDWITPERLTFNIRDRGARTPAGPNKLVIFEESIAFGGSDGKRVDYRTNQPARNGETGLLMGKISESRLTNGLFRQVFYFPNKYGFVEGRIEQSDRCRQFKRLAHWPIYLHFRGLLPEMGGLDRSSLRLVRQSELVDGHECRVVATLNAKGQPILTLWVDPKEEHVVRQLEQARFRGKTPPTRLEIQYARDSSKRLMPTAWKLIEYEDEQGRTVESTRYEVAELNFNEEAVFPETDLTFPPGAFVQDATSKNSKWFRVDMDGTLVEISLAEATRAFAEGLKTIFPDGSTRLEKSINK